MTDDDLDLAPLDALIDAIGRRFDVFAFCGAFRPEDRPALAYSLRWGGKTAHGPLTCLGLVDYLHDSVMEDIRNNVNETDDGNLPEA